MASSIEPRFHCILTSDPENQANNKGALYFDQEEGKKSSFLLKLDGEAHDIDKPAHVLLQCSLGKDKFLFGGLEIVSNARNVEIYLSDEEGKAEYLTTCRGLVVADDPHRFKCLVVCPGGPRPVTRVHLKLLSLKPASCTGASLYILKLKGRLPPPKPQQEETTPNDDPTTRQASKTSNTPAAAPASPALTQADMGTAMMGVSMLVRSVESSLLHSVQSSLDRIESKFNARFDRIEQYLMIQQHQALVQQQQQNERHNELQNQVMTQIKEQQSELVTLVGSLQSQLANQRDQVPHSTTNEADGEAQIESVVESTVRDGRVDVGGVTEEANQSLISHEESGEVEMAADKNNKDELTAEQVATVTHKQDETRNTTESITPSESVGEGIVDEECLASVDETKDEVKVANDCDASDSMDVGEESEDIHSRVESHTQATVYDKQINQDADATAQSDAVSISEDTADGPSETLVDHADHADGACEVEKPSKDEIQRVCALDDNSVPAKYPPICEKKPVMNQRADALEIPNLLSDTPVGEIPLADPKSASPIEQQSENGIT